ncbi:MAG: hypothetical protein LBT75_00550 [Bacilli bacterium]|jgi:hypothetical protein|nr:hypothetical protein [Bacilli bacterium]
MEKKHRIKIFRIILALLISGVFIYFSYPKEYKEFTKLSHFPKIVNFDNLYATNAFLEDRNIAYKIGVEINQQQGTSLYSGKYKASIKGADNYRTVAPLKASIYIGKNIEKTDELKNLKKIGTMGGQYHEADTLEFNVSKGQFIYVLPEKQEKNQATGYIYLELQ